LKPFLNLENCEIAIQFNVLKGTITIDTKLFKARSGFKWRFTPERTRDTISKKTAVPQSFHKESFHEEKSVVKWSTVKCAPQIL
jgi:hypothetical protein